MMPGSAERFGLRQPPPVVVHFVGGHLWGGWQVSSEKGRVGKDADSCSQLLTVGWYPSHPPAEAPPSALLSRLCRYDAFATVMEILAARLRNPGVPPEVCDIKVVLHGRACIWC
jgi:hypothetical protein